MHITAKKTVLFLATFALITKARKKDEFLTKIPYINQLI